MPMPGFAGFVTEFDVDAAYLSQCEVKTVGAPRAALVDSRCATGHERPVRGPPGSR